MTKFCWKAGAEQYPPQELLDYAVAADKAGFDALNVSDHFQPWAEEGQASFAWTWLGAAAVRTSKIHLGPGVTCPILRYHPAIIAQAAATLDAFAPGRTFLCVGTGEALNEYAATGEWPDYELRQAQLAEAIELIRALWSGEEVTYNGAFYQTRKARLYTAPKQPIPLYVSTLVPGSADFAGIYGDGLITVGGKDPEIYQQIIENFEEGAQTAGKDPTQMPRLIELNVAYTSDLDDAVQGMLKYWAGTFIPALYNQKIYTPALSAENGKVVGPDTVLKMCCISEKTEDHVTFAHKYLDLGFDQLYFHSAGPDQRAFIEHYGREVLPELRRVAERAPTSNGRR